MIDDVFIMHRSLLGKDGGWSLASALAAPVNTPDYRDRPGGQGKADI